MSANDKLKDGFYCQLKTLVETLTHSGLKTLDEELFKELKKKCRSSPEATKQIYILMLLQLKKKHSEIRHLAFLICIELFKRSALFRELVIQDLQLIFELTAGTNPEKRLPPPKAVAEILERLALSTLKKWNEEYGGTLKELRIAFNYLKHSKKINFDAMMANNEHELHRQRHEKALQEEKIRRLNEEIDSNETEIENTITELMNCLSLLIPSPDDFFISEDCNDDSYSINSMNMPYCDSSRNADEDSAINLTHFGITSNYSILVNTKSRDNKIEIKKTEENTSIIQNAEDSIKLIKNRFLPLIKKWNHICVKYSSDNGATIQRILKLKERLEKCTDKYKELNIEYKCDNDSDSSDSDFEEVTKEHYEESAPEIENFEIGNPPVINQRKDGTDWKISVGEDGDPASAASTLKLLKEKDGMKMEDCSPSMEIEAIPSTSGVNSSAEVEYTSRKDKLLACAPKLPFDIDLYHWEEENLTAPTLLSIKMDNPRFWGLSTVDDMDEIPNPDGVAALRTRVIEFSGKFEPVKWSCRAPLPNGKLCPRRDRFKCPFHGKIVARDENGVCKDERVKSDNDTKKTESNWQDLEFLQDIKNATGIDLTIDKKGSRSKKKKISKTHKVMKTSSSTLSEIKKRKFPGLTDTIGRQNNSYKRISKKIFKRGALNKVAATLDKIDFSKHRDKFGDQFNYLYQT